MNISKFMLFLLCFLLVFNFCLKPYTVEAVVPTVIGGKLLTFLLAMAAAGVTLSVAGKTDLQLAAEANSLLQKFEEVNGQIEFWQDALLNYLKNKGYQGVNAFTSLLDNIKTWSTSLSLKEGLNEFLLSDSESVSYNIGPYSFSVKVADYKNGRDCYVNITGYDGTVKYVHLVQASFTGLTKVDNITYRIVFISEDGTTVKYAPTFDMYRYDVYHHTVVDHHVRYTVTYPTSVIGYDLELSDEYVDILVDSTAYPLTGIPPNYYRKPDVFPPPVPTTTWDLTTGRNVTTWPGTAEDFADDFADTVTWDDYRDVVTGVPSIPYSLNEDVPGVLTIDYDYDYADEGAGAIPVPYPDTYEGDIPSEGLLQGITNWLTSLINVILSIPAKLIELLKELLITLFVPEPDFVQNKVIDINSKIGDKIGDNDYMNFLDSLKSLQGEPLPNGYLYGNKVFDASYINNMADTVKLWQRWFWYILIVLWYMNNVYKMIRGSDVVRGMEYDAHRGGAKS